MEVSLIWSHHDPGWQEMLSDSLSAFDGCNNWDWETEEREMWYLFSILWEYRLRLLILSYPPSRGHFGPSFYRTFFCLKCFFFFSEFVSSKSIFPTFRPSSSTWMHQFFQFLDPSHHIWMLNSTNMTWILQIIRKFEQIYQKEKEKKKLSLG